MKIEQIKNYDWEQYWVGNWSFLTSCYFGYCYTKTLKRQMGEGFDKVIIISRKGYTSCYMDKRDRKRYGEFVGSKITVDNESILRFSNELKVRADDLVDSIHFLKNKGGISYDDYKKFVAEFMDYNGPHISVRHTIDFLPTDKQKDFLEIFRELRLYVEKVYSETEKFMFFWANQMAKKIKIEPKLILCLTHDEADDVLKGKALPKFNLLNDRYIMSAVLFDTNGYKVYVGEDVKKIEDDLEKEIISDILTGQTAYKGKTSGKVKIIFNPALEGEKFNDSDILVTGMTRPEFLPLMEKASAFITDAGGILSHAAIIAREMKKPCIIGTKIATKVLKDGDLVEVDAERGVVRILKKNDE